MANDYWKDRMAQSQTRLSDRSRKQIEKQLITYYKQTAKRVMADFEDTLYKLRATMRDGKEPTPADLYKLDKYWQLQAQLREELQALGDKEIKLLSQAFETNFFEVYYSLNLPESREFHTISTEGARQLINQIWVADGKSWSQRIWDDTQLLAEKLNEQLIHIVVAGKPTGELKKLLQERFNVSYSRADALVRTELAHIQTQAAKQRYEDYGIGEVEIWADADERRCDVCGELHKKRYPVGAAVPIPAHPRCRCCILPVVE